MLHYCRAVHGPNTVEFRHEQGSNTYRRIGLSLIRNYAFWGTSWVQFPEPLELVRNREWNLRSELSPYVDSRGVDLQDDSWAFTHPLGDSAAGIFKITIRPQGIVLEAKLPTNSLEWFEDRYGIILDEFRKHFDRTS